MFDFCGSGKSDALSSGDEVEDIDAVGLSYVGTAAYDTLRRRHNWYHHSLWNVTSGHVVGELDQTPRGGWEYEADPEEGHDDWFPEKMAEILSRTEHFADVMSLGPPDGLFMTKFNEALKTIVAKELEQTVVVRMMFGNIVGMPVNCDAVLKQLTKGISPSAKLQVWVGAWRRGVSWNHAKIIAVDGKYLHTGGHNLWDGHYLKNNPVHDLSLELAGRVAHDGHLFANEQWAFIEKKQSTLFGKFVDMMPDNLPIVIRSRVTVSEWPTGVSPVFPPRYRKNLVPKVRHDDEQDVPIITMGRYGTILPFARPSDDAFWAMLESAQTIVRLALQDLGPVCLPGTKVPLPGCVWPKKTLEVLGRILWERGVDVEIALSNPGSIPGGLKATEACYGNGWSCVDVAAEIIKSIQRNHPDAEDDDLRKKITENLRVCFIRQKRGNQYEDGKTIGMHAKHFIVDDICTYIGSQNLYICDLAEWGVVIDDEAATLKMMEEYWNPMWASSYADGVDVDVQAVMDGLEIDRDGEEASAMIAAMSVEEQKKINAAALHSTIVSGNSEFYGADDEPLPDGVTPPTAEE